MRTVVTEPSLPAFTDTSGRSIAEIDTRAAWDDDYEMWAIDRIGRLRDAVGSVGGIPPLETPSAIDLPDTVVPPPNGT